MSVGCGEHEQALCGGVAIETLNNGDKTFGGRYVERAGRVEEIDLGIDVYEDG
jgi:hypothetical protein